VNVPVSLGDVPQLSTCGFVPWMSHVMPVGIVLPAVSSVQVTPSAVGKLSDNVTPVASPAPEFDNVTLKPICSPAFTGDLSAVFVRFRFGQLTVMLAVFVPVPPFEEPKLAVLLSGDDAHVADVVGLVTWRMSEVPALSVNVPLVLGDVPQLNVCGFVALTAHEMPVGIVLPAASSVQCTPLAEGNVSDRVTPVASPAPEFDSVTLKPICSPAFTGDLSAVLLMVRFGQLTVIVTDALLPPPPFDEVKLAWLVSVPVWHVAAVVGLVT
jgi:hypothetical protein